MANWQGISARWVRDMAIWVVRDTEIDKGESEMRESESCACGLVSERVER